MAGFAVVGALAVELGVNPRVLADTVSKVVVIREVPSAPVDVEPDAAPDDPEASNDVDISVDAEGAEDVAPGEVEDGLCVDTEVVGTPEEGEPGEVVVADWFSE